MSAQSVSNSVTSALIDLPHIHMGWPVPQRICSTTKKDVEYRLSKDRTEYVNVKDSKDILNYNVAFLVIHGRENVTGFYGDEYLEPVPYDTHH